MKVLIASGGSGGHIFPAVALARELKKDNIEIIFVASRRRLDKKILANENFAKIYISANPMPYRFGPGAALFALKLMLDGFYSLYLLLKVRPDAVVGFGGYTSGAILLLASFLRIRTIIHEQNVVPGRTNAFLGAFADKIAVSFDETRRYFKPGKVVLTGNPLREESLEARPESSFKKFGLERDKITLLIMGGSQGARSLNKITSESISLLPDEMRKGLQVIHIAGPGDSGTFREYYGKKGIKGAVFGFVEAINEAYSAADMAISRAGAAAVFELAAFAKPMVLVPYPSAKNNQRYNAMFFAGKGAAVYVDEKTIRPDGLRDIIARVLGDPLERKRLSENARALRVTDGAARLKEEVIAAVNA